MTAAVIYHHEHVLAALWGVPVVAMLCVYAWRMRTRALRRFAAPQAVRHVIRGRPHAVRAWQALGGCVALAMVIIALARPAWNLAPQTIHRQGRDVVFVLDVSRSMLADDVSPSRLERAKLAIGQCVDQLQGDRVALVAFAGSPRVRCPLTLDYAFFRMAMEDVDPSSVAQGGTRIGDALDAAIAQMPPGKKAGYRDIILITDGEDHGSSPADAAARLDAAGVRLIAIGIGDEERGRRIPVVDPDDGATSFVTDDKGEVWTRLESRTLREMVRRTKAGAYFNVGTGAIDIVGVYRRLVAVAESTELGDQSVLRYEEKFQIFLAAALVMWFGATVSVARDRRRRLSGIFDLRRRMRSKAARVAAALVILMPASIVRGDTLQSHMASGREAYVTGDYAAAVETFVKACETDPESQAAVRNLGNALYRGGRYLDAGGAFEAAASLVPDAPAERAVCIHNAANCLFRRAQALRTDDRPAALRLYRAAARYYRLALDDDATRRDTAHNLEVARRTAKVLADEIKADEDKKRELLAEIRKQLDDLIRRQLAAAATSRALTARNPETPQETDSLGREIDRLAADQKGINADTRKVADLMSAVAALLPSMPAGPDSPPGQMISPMDAPRRHVRAAVIAQGKAQGELTDRATEKALPHQETAAAELKLALDAMPGQGSKDESEDGKGEKKPGDKGEEGEKEAPEKDDGEKPADKDTEFRPRKPGDEDEEFTAPKDSVDDILAEEKLNNARRAKKRPATYKPGDKNW